MANNTTQKSSPIFILFTIGLTAVFIVLLIVVGNKSGGGAGDGNNVSIVDGKQVIEILARGGYSPRKTVAKAGVPTILRVKTQNTYDCSSALVIPALNYRKFLEA
jgi:plastocyanin domain-containing protein